MRLEVVKDSLRPAFPTLFFGDPLFDIKVFNMADRMLNDYSGGYWEYVVTEDAAFMRLSGKDEQTLTNPFSGEEVKMDANASGMILTSYALLREIENGKDLSSTQWALNQNLQDYLEEIDRFDIWMEMMD
jgi:hypothetical protein